MPIPVPVKPNVQLLCFWEPWCQPCRAERPSIIALCQAYGGRVDIVGYSTGRILAPGVPWRSVNGMAAKLAYAQYAISAIPACVFLKDGKEIGRWQGHDESVVAAIDAALAPPRPEIEAVHIHGPFRTLLAARIKADELRDLGFRTEIVGGGIRWHVRAWR